MSKYYDPQAHAEFSLEFLKAEFATGETEASYRAYKALNQSFLKDINEVSPYDAEYKQNNREEPTPAMKIGSLMHCLALTPEEVGTFSLLPECDRRTKEGKLIYEEHLIRSEGKTVIKRDEWELAGNMANAVSKYLPSKEPKGATLDKFHAEAVLYATAIVSSGPFKGHMVELKGKLDGMLPFNIQSKEGSVRIYDLKSVADIGDIAGASYKSCWAMQAALYSDMAEACFQRPAVFEYLCVSKQAPFSVRKAVVSHEMILKGRKFYAEAISKWLWYIHNGCPKTAEFYGTETLYG